MLLCTTVGRNKFYVCLLASCRLQAFDCTAAMLYLVMLYVSCRDRGCSVVSGKLFFCRHFTVETWYCIRGTHHILYLGYTRYCFFPTTARATGSSATIWCALVNIQTVMPSRRAAKYQWESTAGHALASYVSVISPGWKTCTSLPVGRSNGLGERNHARHARAYWWRDIAE